MTSILKRFIIIWTYQPMDRNLNRKAEVGLDCRPRALSLYSSQSTWIFKIPPGRLKEPSVKIKVPLFPSPSVLSKHKDRPPFKHILPLNRNGTGKALCFQCLALVSGIKTKTSSPSTVLSLISRF